MADLTTEPSSIWDFQAKLDEAKKRIEEFKQLFSALKNQAVTVARFPDLKAEYNTLISRGSTIDAMISGATNALNSAYQYIRGVLGLNDAQNELGVLPIFPIAVVTVVGLIGAWIHDVYVFQKRLDEIIRLESKGITPQQAYQMTAGSGMFDSLFKGFTKSIIFPLVLGGVFVFWPQIKKMLKD